MSFRVAFSCIDPVGSWDRGRITGDIVLSISLTRTSTQKQHQHPRLKPFKNAPPTHTPLSLSPLGQLFRILHLFPHFAPSPTPLNRSNRQTLFIQDRRPIFFIRTDSRSRMPGRSSSIPSREGRDETSRLNRVDHIRCLSRGRPVLSLFLDILVVVIVPSRRSRPPHSPSNAQDRFDRTNAQPIGDRRTRTRPTRRQIRSSH